MSHFVISPFGKTLRLPGETESTVTVGSHQKIAAPPPRDKKVNTPALSTVNSSFSLPAVHA